jgi:hypothetical protein
METDTWEALPDLAVGRADMAVAVLNGRLSPWVAKRSRTFVRRRTAMR